MNTELREKRADLRRSLQAQRHLFSQQFTQQFNIAPRDTGSYPRSLTMSLLNRHSSWLAWGMKELLPVVLLRYLSSPAFRTRAGADSLLQGERGQDRAK